MDAAQPPASVPELETLEPLPDPAEASGASVPAIADAERGGWGAACALAVSGWV
ncbi:Segregation and condensation protein A [Acetobacter malorum]|uniref:Segregation and condensation protein A n=1 Tax=Acetobacter malorum TaxID=178901 RepID=A0A177GF47_9PROT|nr:Segregation and condensation protein A [Acetobacter malorum]